ncbi:hypothetical protein D9619_002866 [Psilocybe cf. subviscida]|uniref:DUF7721 domain-containing protein n=1 Tax=Psilocybe cf. subviscida TaxID=2480587 RepID=A0A8H5AVM2_9AGAR|nr:hypothetical protein D9619_002866 [Psilocybe cf. subviscida]
MDTFMNLAKQGYSAYQESQENVSKTGGQEYNAPSHSNQGDQGGQYGPDIDHDEAVRTAEQHGSGGSDLFKSALGFLNNNQQQKHEPVDEDRVTQAHQEAYERGNAGNLDAGSLGSAAALQPFLIIYDALKRFTSGGGSSGGGGSQTQLISLAMAEATKLFDSSGGAASGNKQDAVNGAAMTVMKLLVQSKFSGGTTGGASSGGIGGLMKLVSFTSF